MTITSDIRAIVERVKNLGPEWRHTANVLTDAMGAAEHAQNARLRYLTTCIDEAKGRLAYHKQEIRTLPEQIAKLEAERAHLESQTGLDPLRAVVMGRAPAAVEVAPSDPFVPGLPPLRLRKVWAEWEDIAGDILRFTQDGQKFGWIRVGSAQFLLADVLWEPVTELDSNERYRPHGATWARVEAMADEAEKAAAPKMLDLRDLRYGVWCRMTADCSPLKRGDVFRVSCRSWVGEHINQVSVALDDDAQRRIELPHGLYELPAELVPASPAPTLLDLTKLPPGTACEATADIPIVDTPHVIKQGQVFRIITVLRDGPLPVEAQIIGLGEWWLTECVPARVVKEGGER